MYSVSSQTKYGNFSWNIFYTSVIFDLNLHIKNSLLCTKEFSKFRRWWGWKSISVHSLYTNEVKDCLKPAVIASIHQLLKTTQIHVFVQLRSCQGQLHDSENWPRSPFDRSNFVRLSFTLRILGFHRNWMENICRVVLERCINVIGRNARALVWLTK